MRGALRSIQGLIFVGLISALAAQAAGAEVNWLSGTMDCPVMPPNFFG